MDGMIAFSFFGSHCVGATKADVGFLTLKISMFV
jgi:hypothetical protein